MKKILLGVAILFLITSISYCQESKQTLQRFDKGSPLTLTIKSDKKVYEVGQDIALEVAITNNSGKEIVFFWDNGRVIWHLIPSKTKDGVTESVVETSLERLERNETEIETIYIKPNQSIHKKVSVDGSKSSLGSYRLQFIYNFPNIPLHFKTSPNQELWTKNLISNTITIEVTEKYILNKECIAFGEQEEHWISMLGSMNQQDRDVASKKLLVVFHCSNKEEWKHRLSWVRPGMVLNDVEKELERMTGQKSKATMGDCSGGSCSQSYRLDYCYVLRISYYLGSYDLRNNNKDNKVISSEVIDQMEYKWVEPPLRFTGVWITYYVNGQKSHEVNYKDGKYNGPFTSFYADGSKAVIQHYVDNIAEGEDTGYFPSGRINYRGVYKAGVQVGTWTWYNEDGTVRSTQEHANPS